MVQARHATACSDRYHCEFSTKGAGHSGAHGSVSDALSQIPSVLGAAARISPIHPDPQSRPHFLVLFYDLRSTQDYLGHRDPKHPLRKHEVQDMSRTLISSGSTFEKTAGYSRAVVQGEWCFVSGTTGYDYRSMQIPAGLEDQIANCFKTIGAVLDEAGFSLDDVVRVTYIVSDCGLVPRALACVGSYFRDIRPAATMMIAGLIEEAMKIEIELTALRQS